MQGDSAPRWRVRTIAAAICLGDDAIAALAFAGHRWPAAAHSGALAAFVTRVTTALTRPLAHHP